MIIAVANQKGGVGKTTTAFNLGFALAEMGRSTLLVDFDPQASLTIAAGVKDAAERSIAEVLAGKIKINNALVELQPGLKILPSDIALSETELILVGKLGRESVLKKALGTLTDFDFCLIDCPPSLSILTINALTAANSVLIPAIPQYLDLRAMAVFTRTVELVRAELNPDLEIIGILPTFYDGRLKLHNEVLDTWLAADLPILPLQVKRSVRFAESPIEGRPLADYDPERAEVYKRLAEMLDHAKTT